MSDLDREGDRSLTQQLVDAVAGAVERGDLAAGARLPPTRELAARAGVNHLTAVRAYRRLRELGLVTAHVGRGTFVRETAPARPSRVPDSIAWQRYALPELEERDGSRVVAEMHRHATAEGLIPLSVGYPDGRLLPVDALAEATREVLASEPARALQYADAHGVPELTEQLAALRSSAGAEEDPRDVVVTGGAAQALQLVSRALLRPGDVVACESPSFMGLIEALRGSGARLQPVPGDAHGLDLDALEALLARTEIKLLALQPRARNPTGGDLSPPRRERLVELARRHGFFVLEDGVYGDLRYEGAEPGPLRPLAPAHVIYVDSLSKTIGGGLRLGWATASGPVLDRIVAAKRADDMHSPTLTQLLSARMIASGAYASHLDRVLPRYSERRDAILEAIDRELGAIAACARPLGGHHVWLQLDLAVDERELAEEALRRGVSFVPGRAMCVERPRSLALRLSFGFCEPEEITEGVRRLAAAAKAAGGRPARAEAAPV